MEEKDLKKLKRSELLEIMLAQSEEIDRLRAELAKKDEELASRRIEIERSGSIAEASLRLTKVFEEAQRAADLYVDNVRGAAGKSPQSTNVLPRQRATKVPTVLEADASAPATVPAASARPAATRRPRGRHFG